ncbi:MAG: hypothetical protein H6658_17425 [Ardenticatenaceae bacterium]|nr:hypothetical protein [Ardenticatenaceae bacterium]
MDEEGTSRVYHLFDRDGSLKVVADFASPWLSSENSERYVRFADSSGKTIAQMDLATTAVKSLGGRQNKDYAIVLNHAVYAILSQYHWHDNDGDRIYFVLRVGENMWLALKEESNEPYFTIYDDVPASLISRSAEPMFSNLPEPIGEINWGSQQYDYTITWKEERIERMALLVMALVFLVDRLDDV